MSGYESPTPDAELTPSEGPDAGLPDGGDATGGVGGPEIEPTDIDPLEDGDTADVNPERLDAMSADGTPEPGRHLDGPDIQHPTNWRIT